MKKAMLIGMMLVLCSFAYAQTANDIIKDKGLEIIYKGSSQGYTSYDAGTHVFSVEVNSKKLMLDLDSVRGTAINLASNDYGFSKIEVSAEKIKGDDCPKISFCRISGSECLNVLSITLKSRDPATIYLTKQDPESSSAVVYVVEHARGPKKYLTAVANTKADIIVENNWLKTLSSKDGTTKVSAKSVMTRITGSLRENDILSATRKVMQLFSENSALSLLEETFMPASGEDRYFSTSNPLFINVSSVDKEWTDVNVPDDAQCSEESACFIKYSRSGSLYETCYCTRYSGKWDWRKGDGSACGQESRCCCTDARESGKYSECIYDTACAGHPNNAGEGDVTDEVKTGACRPAFSGGADVKAGCCSGEEECTLPACNKIGFMALNLRLTDSLDKIQEFAGCGGWVVMTFRTGERESNLWPVDSADADAAAQFVNQASGRNLIPVVRILGMRSGPGRTDALQFSGFIKKVYADTGGKAMFFQVHNEPNNDDDWSPATAADYASLLKNLGDDTEISALRSQGKIKIVTAGLSPGNDLDFIREMFSSEPSKLAGSFDVWGAHVYPSWPETTSRTMYRDQLSAIRSKVSGFDKPVLITEAGQGERTASAMEMEKGFCDSYSEWNDDPDVLGAMVFLLYNQDTQFQSTTWLTEDFAEKDYFTALKADNRELCITKTAKCSETFMKSCPLVVKSSDYLSCGTGRFSSSSADTGVAISDKTKDSGTSLCSWKAVYKKLSCAESQGLGFGMVFAQVYNEEMTPITGISLQFGAEEKTTETLADYPGCKDKIDYKGAGFAVFNITGTHTLYPDNPGTSYDYKSYGEVGFDEGAIEKSCSGKMPSFYVRFFQLC